MLRLKHQGRSRAEIAASTGIGESTVSGYVARAEKAGLTWLAASTMTEAELEAKLFRNVGRNEPPARVAVDFGWVHRELARPGVTLQTLWVEYRTRRRARAALKPYEYSRFCDLYARWKRTLGLAMRRIHRAGEKVFIDYSGRKPPPWLGAWLVVHVWHNNERGPRPSSLSEHPERPTLWIAMPTLPRDFPGVLAALAEVRRIEPARAELYEQRLVEAYVSPRSDELEEADDALAEVYFGATASVFGDMAQGLDSLLSACVALRDELGPKRFESGFPAPIEESPSKESGFPSSSYPPPARSA